ncbi:aminoglycoside phosphotransferase family protein [Thermodesulforhabdus norvegica]|uniref:Aminoglycoside phosphotransferase domain-containing protein n=1 Tax=Thermodesulforhabdus norvegica TaxID=39841 RepID=A0A1I4QIX7_9BACT|nr:phosphotransferase [Thermodesulforhabdus norvegica]SFM40038.1 hypothetical protein SAMN05660836_00064 [Thermodesulforhabdus norvegica]
MESFAGIFPDFPAPERIIPLPGDGSERQFFRLHGPEGSAVLIVHPPETETVKRENRAFSAFGRYLKSLGISVPGILAENHSLGFFIVEDAGNVHIQDLVKREARDKRRTLYGKILRLLLDFHIKAPEAFDPAYCLDGQYYDPPFVLEKELEYFRKAFLNDFLSLNVRWKDLADDFSYLAEKSGILTGNTVIHRDFQSRNLMAKQGKIYLLDFQGMRYGPPEYDIASLFLDPYVPVGRSERLSWIAFYASRNPAFSTARFHAVTLCRNLQILAAFAFLTRQKKKIRFAAYIPEAWRALKGNSFLKNCPKLRKLRSLLDIVSPALEKVMDSTAITCYRRNLHGKCAQNGKRRVV